MYIHVYLCKCTSTKRARLADLGSSGRFCKDELGNRGQKRRSVGRLNVYSSPSSTPYFILPIMTMGGIATFALLVARCS